MDLLVSTSYIILALLGSQGSREFVQKVFKGSLTGRLLTEFIAVLELTYVAHESGLLFGLGGVPLFGLYLFGTTWWRTRSWIGVSANPVASLLEFISDSRVHWTQTILLILAQLAGGLIAYRYFTYFAWSLKLSDLHSEKFNNAFQQCSSLIQISPFYAAVVEGLGTFSCVAAWKVLTHFKDVIGGAGEFLFALIVSFLVLIGLNLSGGFFNPVLATAIQYGCVGSTPLEHLGVYWIASAVGGVAAHFLSDVLSGSTKIKSN